MSYQTGNALNVDDLLDRWRLFLIDNGWPSIYWGDRVPNTGKAFTTQRDGHYYTWLSQPAANVIGNVAGPFIRGFMHTGMGTPGSDTQPGAQQYFVAASRVIAPSQAYFFFAGTGRNGAYAYAVIETEAGTYRHFGMGVLEKLGDYVGGNFMHGSYWDYVNSGSSDPDSANHGMPFDDRCNGPYIGKPASTVIRADVPGGDPGPSYWYPNTTMTGTMLFARAGWRGTTNADYGTIKLPYQAAASELTGRAPLMPLWVAAARGSSLFSDMGYPPGMRAIRMDNIEPGQEYTIGSDTWVVFPVSRRNGANGTPNTGIYGYAYRKVL